MPPADRIFEITGTVQGVGFRPFVARLAADLGVSGWVRNDGRGVMIRATAAKAVLDEFAARLWAEVPRAARIEAIATRAPTPPERALAAPEGGFDVGGAERTQVTG